MSTERVYLVVNANREMRVAKRPRVQPDEVAIAINLRFPDNWGRIIGSLDFDVPDFAPEAEAGARAEVES